jgi:uncharacterized protein YnzC (UPF0291/DUF896 family)
MVRTEQEKNMFAEKEYRKLLERMEQQEKSESHVMRKSYLERIIKSLRCIIESLTE